MAWKGSVVSLVLVAGLAISCGGSSNGGSGASGSGGSAGSGATSGTGGSAGSASPPVQQLAAEYAEHVCVAAVGCCNSLDLPTNGCKQKIGTQVAAGLTEALGGPGYSYDPVKWQACLDRLDSAVAACDIPAIEIAFAGCGMGTVPVGGACTRHYQCDVPNGLEPVCNQGTCAAKNLHGVKGEACEVGPLGSLATCQHEEGLFCDTNGGDTGHCASLIWWGGSGCTGQVGACIDGAYCKDDVCTPQQGGATACMDDEECGGGYCDTGACVPQLGEGMACDRDAQCVYETCYGSLCRPKDYVWWSLSICS